MSCLLCNLLICAVERSPGDYRDTDLQNNDFLNELSADIVVNHGQLARKVLAMWLRQVIDNKDA